MKNGNGKKPATPGKLGPDGLTDKIRAFVEAYIGEAAGNAGKAYVMAGYDAAQPAHEGFCLLQQPWVQQALAHYMKERGMSVENAKTTLADLAFASVSNFLRFSEDGKSADVDFGKAAANGHLGQLKKFRKTIRTVKGGGTVETYELEVHDKCRANELILKMNGELVEKHDHNVSFNKDANDPIIDDPELNKFANAYERRLASIAGRDGEPSN